jgi:hypothetical protein
MASESSIAGIENYDGLVAAFRALKSELGLTDKALEALALFPDGWTGKVLGGAQIRGIGPKTLDGLLDVLCCDITLVPNADKIARLESRRANLENNGKSVRPMPRAQRRALIGKRTMQRVLPAVMSEMGKRGAAVTNALLTKRQRSLAARHAARARWGRKAKRSGGCDR